MLPGGIAALLVFAGFALAGHRAARAATNGASPLDDSSVSSLVAVDNAVEAVAARVTPAVVNISVTSKASTEAMSSNNMPDLQNLPKEFQWFFGQNGNGQNTQPQTQIEHGVGSGVIISPDGYVLTNYHVVDGATQIKVTLNDRRIFTGKVVGSDKLNDLAVVKIDGHEMPSIAWGDSTKLHPGQTVLAFGSPFGYFQFSVTRGIVSALNRPNPYSDDARKPGDFIQTDAAINPGNSGGPLVDARGELVGINTFIISDNGSFAGAGFAIPSQIARVSAEEIIKTGTVHHGYLGISMNDVTPDNASFFHLPDATGAIVSQVTSDSPAGLAGLKSGDVLREVDGKKIVNGSSLQVAVTETAPGTEISLGILRDGKPETIKVKVGEYQANKSEVAENSGSGSREKGKLGLAVNDLTPQLREQLDVPARIHGVAIESVRAGSAAEDAGLASGEVIVEVNRKPVESAEQFSSDVRSVPSGKSILLLVWSKEGTSYRVVHPDESGQSGM
jgi:serine protease Do